MCHIGLQHAFSLSWIFHPSHPGRCISSRFQLDLGPCEKLCNAKTWFAVTNMPVASRALHLACIVYENVLPPPRLLNCLQVHVYPINPLSLSNDELYGSFDEATHEWKDGVLARIMRTVCKDEAPDQKWIFFDGPVDTLWIESMNTTLDDNKLLTLLSGKCTNHSRPILTPFSVRTQSTPVLSTALLTAHHVLAALKNTDPMQKRCCRSCDWTCGLRGP
jgi:hypothetical protein